MEFKAKQIEGVYPARSLSRGMEYSFAMKCVDDVYPAGERKERCTRAKSEKGD